MYGPFVQIINLRHSLLLWTRSQEWLQLVGSVAARALSWVVNLLL